MVSIQQDTEHYRYQYITTRHGALLVSLEYNKTQGIIGIIRIQQDTGHYWYQYKTQSIIGVNTRHRALLVSIQYNKT